MRAQTAITCLAIGLASSTASLIAAEPAHSTMLRTRGVLQPSEEITLRSPIDARVKAVHVQPGQAVTAGQALLELDTSDLERDLGQAAAGVEQAAAEAALARSAVERIDDAELRLRTDLGLARKLLARPVEPAAEPGRRRGLADQRIIRAPLRELGDERASTAESQTKKALLGVRMKRSVVETLQENVESLQSQTRVARNSAQDVLNRYKTISSPAAATVSECLIAPHERVSVGQPLVNLIELERVKALLWIPVAHVAAVHRGAPVSIRAETVDRVYTGKISRISLTPHPRTGQYMAEVVLEDKERRLRPGTLVDATIDLSYRTACIPGRHTLPTGAK